MTSPRVASIVFACVVLWLTPVSTAQTLSEADAGITRASEGVIGPATVQVDAVRYFLRNPDQLTYERVKDLYRSSPTLHGRARLAYLAMRMDPRSPICSFIFEHSKNAAFGAVERYLCDRAGRANAHYWRPMGLGCGFGIPRPKTFGLDAKSVARLDALLAADVRFERNTADRFARARRVRDWIRPLGRTEKSGRAERDTSASFVSTLVNRERRILPELLPMIERDALDGRIQWSVAFNAFLASEDPNRALAFTRAHMLRAMNEHRLAACGVRAVMERWGEESDIALIKKVVPRLTDDYLRTVFGPDLETVIQNRREREANAAWARKCVEAWKKKGR